MNAKDYQHPLWQKKRLEVMELAGFNCQFCGSDKNELHIHHITYDHDRPLWDYKSFELVCICCNCHELFHGAINLVRSQLARMDEKSLLSCMELFRQLAMLEASSVKIVVGSLLEYSKILSRLQLFIEQEQEL